MQEPTFQPASEGRDDLAVRDHPDLQPFLPMLYAAWADGGMEPAELTGLESEIERLATLAPSARRALRAWLDPERPPSAETVARLGAHLRSRLGPVPSGLGPAELALRLTGSVDDAVASILSRADSRAGPFEPTAAAELIRREAAGPALAPLPDPGVARFSLTELRRLVDGPHRKTKERVRALLAQPRFAIEHRESIESRRRQVGDWLEILAREGIGGLGLPARVGGSGDPGGFMAAFQVLGHHDLSLLTKFGVQYGLFCGAVLRLGTDRHHRQVLPGAISLDIPGCFAMTETGHGSDVAGLETTASFDHDRDQFVLHTPHDLARKDYIGGAARDAVQAVVFARLQVGELDHGVHAFLVPIRSELGHPLPGIRIEDNGPKAGLDGVDNGRIWFDDVQIPREALLDRYASVDRDGHYESEITSPGRRFFTTLGTLVGGRISVGAAGISAAETALAIAVRYAIRRRQFGVLPSDETPLIHYRAHQRRLLPRLASTYAYHFALADLAEEYVATESLPGDESIDRRVLEARAAGLKAHATWHAVDVVGEARQACGGQGYLWENRLGSLRADVDVFTTYEGDNTVLAQLLAKALLTGHRASFDDLTPARMVRFVRSWVETTLTEAVPRLGSVGDPSEGETQSELMRRRSEHTIETLARRIRKRMDGGLTAAAALLDVQPHALHAARAATELWVHEAVSAAVDRATDPELAEILGKLRSLSALWHVERDLGWFLEHGILTSDGAGQVRRRVTELAAELAEDARHLVDAFGIPDEVLGAPIAR